MGEKKKILVVDDDRLILKFAHNLLEREGHEVVTAEDGIAALNLLTDFTPDIMFFDLIMPKIDGDKLIQIVRKMPHLSHCYLVIVSAAVAEIDFSFQNTGADHYIAKGPFSSMAKNFLAAIETAASPRREDMPKPVKGLEHVYARQLTKELLSRNRHLETIIESMGEGILEVHEGSIVYANAAAINIFGIPQEKLIAAYPPDLFNGPVSTRLDQMFTSDSEELQELGENSPIEMNGRQVTIRKLPVKGDHSTVMLMITDITERKRLEMQLQHVQKMEAIGTIAAGVAHNFRNTLTEILVNSQVIQMNYKEQPELQEITGRISTSVKRGARLVDGLLQFSRKQIKKEFRTIDLAEAVRETYRIIRESFDQKIEIDVSIPDSIKITGDLSGISQVLMNLCTNARDAMPDGGQLIMEGLQQGSMAVLKVSDTGEGMSRDTLEKCFDPFFTTKSIGKGTGLGLSTTYGIVKSHEGSISVESQPDQGTAFKLQFPVTQDEEVVLPEITPEIMRGKGQHILVVDDEDLILKAMQDLLISLGYHPEFAACGRDALEIYKVLQPDLVLMDINMPEMDGLECAEQILTLDPDARIAILSGYEPARTKLSDTLERKIVKGYLTKPVDLAELSTFLAGILKE